MAARTASPAGDATTTERDVTDRIAAPGLTPEETLLGRERRRQIAGALARLPERQRSVFVLSHVEGRTSKEVSAMTGLNESTVRVHLFRAIRRLRAMLAHDVGSVREELKGKRRVTS
jgi:RNA polymerase sigma-70 factor (ECF subfamily)